MSGNFKTAPSTNYNFNALDDIRTHSAALFNERLAWLFMSLDLSAVNMNINYSVDNILEVRGYLKQIYKNVRMLISNNPVARAMLNLETKDEGTYITDVHMGMIDKMIDYAQENGWSKNRITVIINELNDLEVTIRKVLQYYNYFVRPNFKQKPDIDMAVEKYKFMADDLTIDQLKEIVGKKNKVDFNMLTKEKEKSLSIDNQGTVIDEDDDRHDYHDGRDMYPQEKAEQEDPFQEEMWNLE